MTSAGLHFANMSYLWLHYANDQLKRRSTSPWTPTDKLGIASWTADWIYPYNGSLFEIHNCLTKARKNKGITSVKRDHHYLLAWLLHSMREGEALIDQLTIPFRRSATWWEQPTTPGEQGEIICIFMELFAKHSSTQYTASPLEKEERLAGLDTIVGKAKRNGTLKRLLLETLDHAMDKKRLTLLPHWIDTLDNDEHHYKNDRRTHPGKEPPMKGNSPQEPEEATMIEADNNQMEVEETDLVELRAIPVIFEIPYHNNQDHLWQRNPEEYIKVLALIQVRATNLHIREIVYKIVEECTAPDRLSQEEWRKGIPGVFKLRTKITAQVCRDLNRNSLREHRDMRFPAFGMSDHSKPFMHWEEL